MKRAFFAALLVCCASRAAADEPRHFSAFELKTMCEEGEKRAGYKTGFCMGFILAISESQDPGARKICWPRAVVPNGQLQAVVLRWLQHHPEKLHVPAWHAILMSFQEAFPCRQARQ